MWGGLSYTASILCKLGVFVNQDLSFLGSLAEKRDLLIGHLGKLYHFSVLIGGNELFDNHVSSTDSDDQFSIKNLGIDLLSTE